MKVVRTGRDEAAAWLRGLELAYVPRWHVEVALDAGPTRFHINIYEEEWGFAFRHAGRASWIRVVDRPFVHGRDDFDLLARTPALHRLKSFIVELEREHGIELRRDAATIRTNVPDGAPRVRAWLARI